MGVNNQSLIEKIKNIYDIVKEKANDINDIELYMSKSSEEEFIVRERDLDKYTFAESIGIGIRIIKDGRVGISFTEKIDNEKDLEILIENAKISMKHSMPEEYNTLTKEDNNIKENTFNMINENIINLSSETLTKLSLDIEDKLYSLDKKIDNVPSAGIGRYKFQKAIINSNGICKEEIKNSISYFAEVIAKENDIVKTGFDIYNSTNEVFDKDSFCRNIVDNAINKLNAKPIKSDKYKTIFSNKAMRTIIGAYLGLFSAESVQKQISLFKDKIDKQVANSIINIKDIPLLENGLANTNFDGEGSTTKNLTIIENGILKNFLYNNYTAKKDSKQTTAHATRGFKTPIGISCHNFMLEQGNYNLEELIKKIDNGILVTSLSGVHSGVNSISGDFSLQSEGIKIENGELTYTTSPFIVSGNILDLLLNIEALANDIDYNKSSIYAPSALIKELSFAC